jgi:hypothetical protein
MSFLTFEGRIENGRIRLPDDVKVPDHTKVYVVIPDVTGEPRARVYSPRLGHPQQAAEFAKEIIEVRADAEL